MFQQSNEVSVTEIIYLEINIDIVLVLLFKNAIAVENLYLTTGLNIMKSRQKDNRRLKKMRTIGNF